AHPNVAEMKQTSGKYSEIQFVKSNGAGNAVDCDTGRSVKLDNHQWDETVRKLAAMYGAGRMVAPGLPTERIREIKARVLSALQEDETGYNITAVLSITEGSLKIATVAWLKESLESWIAKKESRVPSDLALPRATYALPRISEAGCVDDTWAATAG